MDGAGDGSTWESNAAVTVQGDHDATIELDGKNELKSGGYHAGLEKNDEMSEDGETILGKLTIKDDNDTKGSLTAEGGDGGAGIGGGKESTGSGITIQGGAVKAVGGSNAAGIGDGAGRASGDTDDPESGRPLHLRRRRGDGQGGEPDDGRQGPGHRRKVRRDTHREPF